jgi:hypothetical protein
MSEKPKRPPFQIHLSTMIVASLLAGIMIYADMHYYHELSRVTAHDSETQQPNYRYRRAYAANETLRLALLEGSVLIFFVLGCEFIIRHREARKA